MARSDLLRRLFEAFADSNDLQFRQVATEIVAEERLKNHHLLADELAYSLGRGGRPGASQHHSLRPLPKGRDDKPLLKLTKPKLSFDALALSDGVRETLDDLVRELAARHVLASHGLEPRRKILFVGESGTGKSASAHAIAHDLSLPVAAVTTATLTSSYLGETGRNIEAVLRFAEHTPCVLIFDEVAAVVGDRATSSDHAEMRRVVGSVLQLFEELEGESVLVATSNHPELIDKAMWRRFDEIVNFSNLTDARRRDLIELKLRSVNHDVSIPNAARRTARLSPADIESLCLDAMRRHVLSGEQTLTSRQFNLSLRRFDHRVKATTKNISEDADN